MQINSGYGDAKEERLQRILVDFKFTDYSHETLESVTVNLKDLFEEYGYIPKAKAIPIEWIKSKINAILDSYPDGNEETEILCKLLYEWEKENETEESNRNI